MKVGIEIRSGREPLYKLTLYNCILEIENQHAVWLNENVKRIELKFFLFLFFDRDV